MIRKGPRSWMILYCRHYHAALPRLRRLAACVPDNRIVKEPRRGPRAPTDWPPARGRGRHRTTVRRPRPEARRGSASTPRRPRRDDSRPPRRSIADCWSIAVVESSATDPAWGAGVGPPREEGGADVASISASARYGPEAACTPSMRAGISKEILRKEVIQPQVPLRLPCYDLVPITGFIFGACLAAPATSDAPRFGGLTGGVYKAQEHIHRGMLIRDY